MIISPILPIITGNIADNKSSFHSLDHYGDQITINTTIYWHSNSEINKKEI